MQEQLKLPAGWEQYSVRAVAAIIQAKYAENSVMSYDKGVENFVQWAVGKG